MSDRFRPLGTKTRDQFAAHVQAGLKDLRRDRRAGALERSAFLQRAAMRAQSAAKAAMRAAARAAGAKAS